MVIKKTIPFIILLPVIITVSSLVVLSQNISIDNLKKHIIYLSSDSLEGRGTSTNGELLAAEYIRKYFKQLNLLPKGKNNSYFYDFTFKKNPNPHDTVPENFVERKGYNVIGFLDNSAEYTIAIGAHFDHLGLGTDGNSLDTEPEGKIHNGADDNASGTAGVLELARYFSLKKFQYDLYWKNAGPKEILKLSGKNKLKGKFNFLFLCFSGEELGLYGSKKYCDDPTIDLKTINYMLNMDMIGRMNDSTKKVVLYGLGTAPDFFPLVDKIKTDMKIIRDSSGIGPSDQTSFYLKDVPVLHFFTGQHEDYHKPSDDEDMINYNGEVIVLEYIIKWIEETEQLSKLKFTPTRTKSSDTPHFKVTLGIMPDYTFEGKGVKVDGVSPDKPAKRAGIMKNDIIVQLGITKTENMMDYMKALSGFSAFDSTEVQVLRNDSTLKLKVVFGK